jgi:tRNA(fMet)-specific endonuclease VapC
MGGASPTHPTGSGSGVYLLDSSVLIPSLRGDATIRARVAGVQMGYISSIVLGELYFGAYGSPTRQAVALQDVATVMTTVTVLASDATTAEIYGRIKQVLKRKGLQMPDNDLWIAATAIQYDITLAAHDSHFDWIDGLKVEQW